MSVIAALIAVVASLSEILSNHKNRPIDYIFNWYLIIFISANGILAFIIYIFLPEIANTFLDQQISNMVNGNTWPRVFIASFGYLLIVRSKFITVRDKPIGIEIFYEAFTQYCLNKMTNKIRNQTDKVLEKMYTEKHFNEVERYCIALETRIIYLPQNQREDIQDKIKLIVISDDKKYIKCKKLGLMLLELVGGSENDLLRTLENVPDEAVNTAKDN